MKRYEQFPHTADIGVRVYGADLPGLFGNAAFAMFDIIADLDGLTGTVEQAVELTAPGPEELLVAWLDELLYHFYTKQVIYYRFEIRAFSGTALKAVAYGRPVGANRNRLKTEIKAATYADLAITKADGGYMTEIIFDT